MSLETVIYRARDLDGTSTDYAGVKALKRMTSGSTAGVGTPGAQATVNNCRWHVQASTLDSSVTPKRGDRIVRTSGEIWEVLSADTATFATRYALNCRRAGS